MKYVIYSYEDEIFVCTPEQEEEMIKTFFPDKDVRDIDEAHRTVINSDYGARIWFDITTHIS